MGHEGRCASCTVIPQLWQHVRANGHLRLNGGLLPTLVSVSTLTASDLTKYVMLIVFFLFPHIENAFEAEYQKLQEYNESLYELRKECTAKR